MTVTTNDIDLRDVRCPVSTMRLKKHLKGISKGVEFTAYSDDDEARTDFPALLKKMNATLVAFSDGPDFQTYMIRKD